MQQQHTNKQTKQKPRETCRWKSFCFIFVRQNAYMNLRITIPVLLHGTKFVHNSHS